MWLSPNRVKIDFAVDILLVLNNICFYNKYKVRVKRYLRHMCRLNIPIECAASPCNNVVQITTNPQRAAATTLTPLRTSRDCRLHRATAWVPRTIATWARAPTASPRTTSPRPSAPPPSASEPCPAAAETQTAMHGNDSDINDSDGNVRDKLTA